MEVLHGSTINFYGILTAVGLVLALVVIYVLSRKRDFVIDDLIFCGLWTAVGAFLGAHLLFFFVNAPNFFSGLSKNPPIDLGDFFTRVYFASSGLVFYGGLLGALLALIIYIKKRHHPERKFLNIFVLVFPLFHGVGRIGCVFSGCCYGIEYHGFGAISYPHSVIIEGINDHIVDFSRFPVQPLEAILEFLLFGIMLWLYIKKGDSIALTPVYLLSYAVIRFLDEFLRGDENRGIWGPFSTSQWIALAVIVCTLIYLIFKKSQRNSVSASTY